MFTTEEFFKAWKLLQSKGKVDCRGYNNMQKVLKFLDNKFDKEYDWQSLNLNYINNLTETKKEEDEKINKKV